MKTESTGLDSQEVRKKFDDEVALLVESLQKEVSPARQQMLLKSLIPEYKDRFVSVFNAYWSCGSSQTHYELPFRLFIQKDYNWLADYYYDSQLRLSVVEHLVVGLRFLSGALCVIIPNSRILKEKIEVAERVDSIKTLGISMIEDMQSISNTADPKTKSKNTNFLKARQATARIKQFVTELSEVLMQDMQAKILRIEKPCDLISENDYYAKRQYTRKAYQDGTQAYADLNIAVTLFAKLHEPQRAVTTIKEVQNFRYLVETDGVYAKYRSSESVTYVRSSQPLKRLDISKETAVSSIKEKTPAWVTLLGLEHGEWLTELYLNPEGKQDKEQYQNNIEKLLIIPESSIYRETSIVANFRADIFAAKLVIKLNDQTPEMKRWLSFPPIIRAANITPTGRHETLAKDKNPYRNVLAADILEQILVSSFPIYARRFRNVEQLFTSRPHFERKLFTLVQSLITPAAYERDFSSLFEKQSIYQNQAINIPLWGGLESINKAISAYDSEYLIAQSKNFATNAVKEKYNQRSMPSLGLADNLDPYIYGSNTPVNDRLERSVPIFGKLESVICGQDDMPDFHLEIVKQPLNLLQKVFSGNPEQVCRWVSTLRDFFSGEGSIAEVAAALADLRSKLYVNVNKTLADISLLSLPGGSSLNSTISELSLKLGGTIRVVNNLLDLDNLLADLQVHLEKSGNGSYTQTQLEDIKAFLTEVPDVREMFSNLSLALQASVFYHQLQQELQSGNKELSYGKFVFDENKTVWLAVYRVITITGSMGMVIMSCKSSLDRYGALFENVSTVIETAYQHFGRLPGPYDALGGLQQRDPFTLSKVENPLFSESSTDSIVANLNTAMEENYRLAHLYRTIATNFVPPAPKAGELMGVSAMGSGFKKVALADNAEINPHGASSQDMSRHLIEKTLADLRKSAFKANWFLLLRSIRVFVQTEKFSQMDRKLLSSLLDMLYGKAIKLGDEEVKLKDRSVEQIFYLVGLESPKTFLAYNLFNKVISFLQNGVIYDASQKEENQRKFSTIYVQLEEIHKSVTKDGEKSVLGQIRKLLDEHIFTDRDIEYIEKKYSKDVNGSEVLTKFIKQIKKINNRLDFFVTSLKKTDVWWSDPRFTHYHHADQVFIKTALDDGLQSLLGNYLAVKRYEQRQPNNYRNQDAKIVGFLIALLNHSASSRILIYMQPQSDSLTRSSIGFSFVSPSNAAAQALYFSYQDDQGLNHSMGFSQFLMEVGLLGETEPIVQLLKLLYERFAKLYQEEADKRLRALTNRAHVQEMTVVNQGIVKLPSDIIEVSIDPAASLAAASDPDSTLVKKRTDEDATLIPVAGHFSQANKPSLQQANMHPSEFFKQQGSKMPVALETGSGMDVKLVNGQREIDETLTSPIRRLNLVKESMVRNRDSLPPADFLEQRISNFPISSGGEQRSDASSVSKKAGTYVNSIFSAESSRLVNQQSFSSQSSEGSGFPNEKLSSGKQAPAAMPFRLPIISLPEPDLEQTVVPVPSGLPRTFFPD